MATALVSCRPDRTNSLLLVFSDDLDSASFELVAGSLVAADGGEAPGISSWVAVAGHPEQVRVLCDGAFRPAGYTLSWSSLLDWTGAALSGSSSFAGLEPSSPRRFPYDRQLKIDLDFAASVGGDVGILVGDSWLKEQAIRLHTWQRGELLADPEFGVPWTPQGPVTGRMLAEFRRASERKLKLLPGVRAAKTTLIVQGDVLHVRCEIRTSQTELEVTVQRLLGR